MYRTYIISHRRECKMTNLTIIEMVWNGVLHIIGDGESIILKCFNFTRKKKANNFTRKRKRRHVSELCVIFLTHQTAHSFSLYPWRPATQPMKKSSTGLNWTLHFLPISSFYETWSKWKSQAGVVLLYRFKLKIAMGHFFWGTL